MGGVNLSLFFKAASGIYENKTFGNNQLFNDSEDAYCQPEVYM